MSSLPICRSSCDCWPCETRLRASLLTQTCSFVRQSASVGALAERVSAAAVAGRPNDKTRTSTPARMIRTLRTAIAPSRSYPTYPERDDARPLPEYLEPPKIHRSAQRVNYANGLVANGWDARLLDEGLHSDARRKVRPSR